MRIVTIGGASRSGSTLLALLLGRRPGAVVVGELRYVWTRGYLDNSLCGCGTPFRACPFWRSVFDEAFGAFDADRAAVAVATQEAATSAGRLPALLATRDEEPVGPLRDHVETMRCLLGAIAAVSGADVVVDSSKLPSYCYPLSSIEAADTRLVHLVRDSRAVAFSFLRKRRKPEVYWTEAYMRRFSPMKSAADWTALNLSMEGLGRVRDVMRVRYEDLVRDPDAALGRIFGGWGAGDVRIDGSVALGENHTVSGNPLRFTRGTVAIRADEEWRAAMRTSDRLVTTAATWPLLRRYGYAGARRADTAGRIVSSADVKVSPTATHDPASG